MTTFKKIDDLLKENYTEKEIEELRVDIKKDFQEYNSLKSDLEDVNERIESLKQEIDYLETQEKENIECKIYNIESEWSDLQEWEDMTNESE